LVQAEFTLERNVLVGIMGWKGGKGSKRGKSAARGSCEKDQQQPFIVWNKVKIDRDPRVENGKDRERGGKTARAAAAQDIFGKTAKEYYSFVSSRGSAKEKKFARSCNI